MTNTDRILQALNTANRVLCDDCISSIANVLPRQQVNAIATSLFAEGRIFRQGGQLCGECGRIKKGSAPLEKAPLAQTSILPPVPPIPTTSRPQIVKPIEMNRVIPAAGDMNAKRPWHWEGNVQLVLRRYLELEGWTITHFANTESKESGIDLGAVKESRRILFEVKGYPTTVYDHGPNRGQFKPTPPNSQARQWYSHAMLGMMRLREKHPCKEIALCFPDFPTYRKLVESTRSSLQILGVAVYLVSATGDVLLLLERDRLEVP